MKKESLIGLIAIVLLATLPAYPIGYVESIELTQENGDYVIENDWYRIKILGREGHICYAEVKGGSGKNLIPYPEMDWARLWRGYAQPAGQSRVNTYGKNTVTIDKSEDLIIMHVNGSKAFDGGSYKYEWTVTFTDFPVILVHMEYEIENLTNFQYFCPISMVLDPEVVALNWTYVDIDGNLVQGVNPQYPKNLGYDTAFSIRGRQDPQIGEPFVDWSNDGVEGVGLYFLGGSDPEGNYTGVGMTLLTEATCEGKDDIRWDSFYQNPWSGIEQPFLAMEGLYTFDFAIVLHTGDYKSVRNAGPIIYKALEARLNNALQLLKQAPGRAEMKQLEDQIHSLQAQLSQAQSEVSQLTEQVESLQGKLAQAQNMQYIFMATTIIFLIVAIYAFVSKKRFR